MSAAEERMPPRLSAGDGAWLALALVLRMGFALKLGDGYYQVDEGGFLESAQQWLQTGLLGADGRAFGGPLLPTVFFGSFLRFSTNLLWPRLGQAAIGTLTAWMIGRMTSSLTGSARAGRIALAVSCVYPFFIYYGGVLMSETSYLALSVAGLWALCESLAEGGASRRLAAGAGALLAAAALCRTECAPITALLWAAGAGLCQAGRWRWKALLAAAACWALVLGLWGARNKAVGGRFGLDEHGGISLLHGTMLFDLNEDDTAVAMKEFAGTELYRRSMTLDAAERDRLYLRAGLDFMASHPLVTLRQWGRKTLNFWRFYPRSDKRYYATPYNNPNAGFSRRALSAVSLLFEPALILGGLAGWWGLRRRWAALLPLPLFLLGTMAIHVVVVSQMRYRLPVMPVLILGLAFLLARPAQSARR